MTFFATTRCLAFGFLAWAIAAPGMGADAKSRADLPDPLVGTWSMYELSHGNTYPGVFTPFGMLGWTAQMTEGNGWPYQYFRETLIGFMATHQPSAWMSNYGPFSLMPHDRARCKCSRASVPPISATTTSRRCLTATACCLMRTRSRWRWRHRRAAARSASRSRKPKTLTCCSMRATAAARSRSIPRTTRSPAGIRRVRAIRRTSRNISWRCSTIRSRATAFGRFRKTGKAGRCRTRRR